MFILSLNIMYQHQIYKKLKAIIEKENVKIIIAVFYETSFKYTKLRFFL